MIWFENVSIKINFDEIDKAYLTLIKLPIQDNQNL